MRIGHGYDVHRLVEGRDLILGGVKIDYEKGLDGHSDADVPQDQRSENSRTQYHRCGRHRQRELGSEAAPSALEYASNKITDAELPDLFIRSDGSYCWLFCSSMAAVWKY